MTTEISLAKTFQPNQKDHVQWLQKMFEATKKLNEQMTSNSQAEMRKKGGIDLVKILKQNPMNVPIKDVDSLNFPMIHMSIGMRYSEAVLKGQAWIPELRSE